MNTSIFHPPGISSAGPMGGGGRYTEVRTIELGDFTTGTNDSTSISIHTVIIIIIIVVVIVNRHRHRH